MRVRGHHVYGLATLLLAEPAWSQLSPRMPEADALFAEGRSFMAEGATMEACDRFARSYELLPRSGTELNLAVCLERQGKSAEAIRYFRRAVVAAERDARVDRLELAQRHLAHLTGKLAWLAVRLVDEAALGGVVVHLDGEPITETEGIPLEPGPHTISVQADGHVVHEEELNAAAGESYTMSFLLPKPDPLVTSPESSQPGRSMAQASAWHQKQGGGKSAKTTEPMPLDRSTSSGASPGSSRLGWGVALLGTGIATLVAGTYFGMRAVNAGSELDTICPTLTCATPKALVRGREVYEEGEKAAMIANVTVPLGVLLSASGIYLVAMGPRAPANGREARSSAGNQGELGLRVRISSGWATAFLETMW